MAEDDSGQFTWPTMVWRIRAALLVFVLMAVAVVLPPQMRDMLADLPGFGRGDWGAAIAFHAAAILLGLSLWYWSRAALLAYLRQMDGQQMRAGIAAQAREGRCTEIAFQHLPRLLFLGIAAVAAYAAYDSGKWLQIAIIVVWAALLYWALMRRLTWQQRLGFAPKLRAPRALAVTFTARVRGHVLDLLDFAPGGRIFSAAILFLAVGIFVVSALTTFLPVSEMGIPAAMAHTFPGPTVALLLFGLAVGPLTAISYLVDRTTVTMTVFGCVWALRYLPVLTILLVATFVSTQVFNLHALRVADVAGDLGPGDRASLAVYFQAWADQCTPDDGPVRPIIVAVSGGASRAGLWGLRVLKAVDDTVRDRRLHNRSASIFAISSVSGGSFGTAAYLAMRAKQAEVYAHARKGRNCSLYPVRGARTAGEGMSPDAARWNRAVEALRADALGPALSGMLLGDAPRALAAYPVFLGTAIYRAITGTPVTFRGNDRAEALERAFEENWKRTAINDAPVDRPALKPFALSRPYLSLFYAASRKPRAFVPAWIANGTDGQNGDRLLTTPFPINKERLCDANGSWTANGPCEPAQHKIYHAFNFGVFGPFLAARDVLAILKSDVPISTAIDDTSRFPFLSPSGELTPVGQTNSKADSESGDDDGPAKPQDAQIIDGGYYENEGLETALELAHWLHDYGPSLLRADKTGKPRPVYPIIVQATADADTGISERHIIRCSNAMPPNPAVSAGAHRSSQFLVPFVGLNAVRSGHSHAALERAHDEFCDEDGRQAFFHFYLYNSAEGVPLNWVLSAQTASYIWDDAIAVCGNAAEQKNLHAALAATPPPAPGPHTRKFWSCVKEQVTPTQKVVTTRETAVATSRP